MTRDRDKHVVWLYWPPKGRVHIFGPRSLGFRDLSWKTLLVMSEVKVLVIGSSAWRLVMACPDASWRVLLGFGRFSWIGFPIDLPKLPFRWLRVPNINPSLFASIPWIPHENCRLGSVPKWLWSQGVAMEKPKPWTTECQVCQGFPGAQLQLNYAVREHAAFGFGVAWTFLAVSIRGFELCWFFLGG